MIRYTGLLVVMLCWVAGASWAMQPVAEARQPAAPPPKPAAAAPQVVVNVTVTVRVSHDTNIDVRIDAPVTPVIGSVQLPDFVQNFLGKYFLPAAPSGKEPASKAKSSTTGPVSEEPKPQNPKGK